MNRCLILSNRLPLSYNSTLKQFQASSGGLVSAIKGINPDRVNTHFKWIGIMTDDLGEEKIEELKSLSFGKIELSPIRVQKKIYEQFYNEYSNNVLWPLFHYEQNLVHYNLESWSSYKNINQIVADHIISVSQKDDLIWVHDFHFFLVPGMIKEKRPELKVGFFLHIPFPSSEIFRELPQREEVLKSLVKADLIGFHDLSYVNHFKSSVTRVLGLNMDEMPEKKCGVYPISIDTPFYMNLAEEPKTFEFYQRYQSIKDNKFWILGIDRLDYIKGITLKLHTFKDFLKNHPKWVGKIQFLQLVIPSREDVRDYQNLKNQIEQLISNINGEFGHANYSPVIYVYKSIDQNELSALYQVSDLLYVGSHRDGMNLVCLEYIASQKHGSEGQILLSEFAGAHSTLSHVFSINPWNIEDTCYKMSLALTATKESKSFKINEMKNLLKEYTSSDWAELFLTDLSQASDQMIEANYLDNLSLFVWRSELKNKKILLFCDLDGTLLPIKPNPKDVFLDEEAKKLLSLIQSGENLELIIISGRNHDFLEQQFPKNELYFSMAACHGSLVYSKETRRWVNILENVDMNWKFNLLHILQLYTVRTPQSFIEEKEHSVVWHFRNSPSGYADFQSNKLLSELEKTFKNSPISISKGKKIIEIKSIFSNKGLFLRNWIESIPEDKKPDIIIAIGDDSTDEDMFRVLKDQTKFPSISLKVGPEKTLANFSLKNQQEVPTLIKNILS